MSASVSGSGKASRPGRTSRREAVPIEAVGQATSAMSARRRRTGRRLIADEGVVGASAKTAGAMRRQVSQSMQVEST